MLQFTLPLPESEEQTIARGTKLKTIQLFILKSQDFHTAVNYLSHNAGMRHCHLKNVSANLMDTNARRNSQSQPQESSSTSTMGPPMGPPMVPPMGPPMVPPMEPETFGWRRPVKIIPGSFSRGTNPYPMLVGDYTQRPRRLGPTVYGRIPSQEHPYRPSPSAGPQNPPAFYTRKGSRNTQWLRSRGPGVGVLGDRMPLYARSVSHASMASHAPSPRPMQHNGLKPPPSNHQLNTESDDVPDGAVHDRFDGQPADQADQASSSARRTVSMMASPLEEKQSYRLPSERPASRSPSIPKREVPVNIQVLEPPDESSYPDSGPKIRWEFTLHLPPSTMMWVLCLHAANHIYREYRSTVDSMALEVRSRNGTIFEDQDILSEVVLQGEPFILIERRHADTSQPVPANFNRSSVDPLQLDSTPQADNSTRSERRLVDRAQMFPASFDRSSIDPLCPGWASHDEADRVPSPRQLPFPLVAAPAPPRSSSPTVAAQVSLSERPDLMNTSTRTRASEQLEQPISQNIRTKAATKKQPGSRQKRAPSASKRPASSAAASKLVPSATTQLSELQALKKRPETSLGIARKRKAPSSNEGVSPAMPPVIESVPSGAEVSKQEMATTSCVGCKNKRRKCNRLKPACDQCLKDNRQCIYPNNQETAATGSVADQACKGNGLEIVNHPMVLRSQAVHSLPVMSDASTQTSHSRKSRNIATQTQVIEPNQNEVDMKDVGTDPCNLYTDASTETDGCDDIWLPFSKAAEVVVWACRRSEEMRPIAVEIFKITDPFHPDYRSQVEQAMVYAIRWEKELREKCEEVLRR